MRQGYRGFEWVTDYIQKIALAFESRIANREALWMNEYEGLQLFGLCAEGVELWIRQLLSIHTASDERSLQTKLFDPIFQLLRCQVGILQCYRRIACQPGRVSGADFGKRF